MEKWGVKERIKNVLTYKKPKVTFIILAGIVCVVVMICFLTNPKNSNEKTIDHNNSKDSTDTVTTEDKTYDDFGEDASDVISAFTVAYLNKDLDTMNSYVKDGIEIVTEDIGVNDPIIDDIEGLSLQEDSPIQEGTVQNTVVSFRPSSKADFYMKLNVGIEYFDKKWRVINCMWNDTAMYPISTEEVTEKVEEPDSLEEPQTSTVQAPVTETNEYIGTWKLNGEMTQNNLKNYDSIYDVYGTGLRDYGGEIQLTETGEINMFLGIGYSATGSYQIADGTILAEVSRTATDGVVETTMTYEIVKVDGITYLTTDIYGETVYWSK